MNVIPAFLEDQSLILFGIHYDHVGGEKDRAFGRRPEPVQIPGSAMVVG
jgi:hypothetical protein